MSGPSRPRPTPFWPAANAIITGNERHFLSATNAIFPATNAISNASPRHIMVGRLSTFDGLCTAWEGASLVFLRRVRNQRDDATLPCLPPRHLFGWGCAPPGRAPAW